MYTVSHSLKILKKIDAEKMKKWPKKIDNESMMTMNKWRLLMKKWRQINDEWKKIMTNK